MSAATQLADRAAGGDRHAVAQLVSLIEDHRPTALPSRREVFKALERSGRRRGLVVGITGSPGSGKSSLISRLADGLLRPSGPRSLAVVAVDPSSQSSRGALLGDRTRLRPATAERVFVRSQASSSALGGLAPTTHLVAAVLTWLFDLVLVETVGIGQSEADIRHLAAEVVLVVGPLGGDEVQYLKAGIVEIPDLFVVSKWDEPAAARTFHQLRASLTLARPLDVERLAIHRTSAKTGEGVALLADDLRARLTAHDPDASALSAARHFFARWVSEEWGHVGLRHLAHMGGARACIKGEVDLVGAHASFNDSLLAYLVGCGARPSVGGSPPPVDPVLR